MGLCPISIPAGVQVGVHIRHLGLNKLELSYGCPKLLSLVRIVKGGVAAGLHDTCAIFNILILILGTVPKQMQT